MIRTGLVLATITATLMLGGCATQEAPPPVKTGYLSTYRNLEKLNPETWRYIDPNNRLARYDKFNIAKVEFSLPEGARAWDEKAGDLKAVADYMREALVNAISDKYEVTTTPAWDVADVKVALTDAYDKDGRVGIAIEAEVLDSVSQVQIGALVQSKQGKNLTFNTFWRNKDAKAILDGWAQTFRDTIDAAHSGS
jgi:hypothetical protein